jgi:hypothetical protein
MLVAAILLPHVILWAWERPEDLRFVNPQQVGVAFLARTVFLGRTSVRVRPRLQPLRLAPGTRLIAVARVEARGGIGGSPEQRAQTVRALAEMASLPNLAGVQVDFDATLSQRGFYAAVLRDLHAALPKDLPLSITALVSWCDDRHSWLAGLPFSEALPMLFRMGPDRGRDRHRDFQAEVCRHSIGISTDETVSHLPASKTQYVFNPHSWTPAAVAQVLKEAGQ